MKKVSLTILFIFGVWSTLCGMVGSIAAAQDERGKWPKILTIATLPEGTPSYIMAAALGKQIESKLGIPVTVTIGAASEGVRLVSKGEAEFSVPSNTIMYSAVRGTDMFTKEGRMPVQYLTAAYPMVVHFMSTKKIKSFEDFRGKRCMFDFPGAPYFMTTVDLLLEFHGMTRKDINIMKCSNPNEVSSGLIAGTLDSGIRAAPATGSPALQITANDIDLNFYSLSKAEEEFIRRKAPASLGFYTIPAGTYKGQSEPIRTIGDGKALSVRRDLPEGLVYEVAKMLLEGADKNTPGNFMKYHKSLSWTLQDNVDLLRQKLAPFHPGAVKYLKERGVWTPDLEGIQAELINQFK